MPPKVSVVLPVRNGARFIQASIRSILDQTFGDFELIVIDDGSTDGTDAMLAPLERDDSRVRALRHTQSGLAASLNRGIELAAGEYIARQDADDISLPQRLERQVERLEADDRLAALGTAAIAIDEQGQPVAPLRVGHGADVVRAGLHALRATLVHGSVMMRASSVRAVGGYREGFRAAQDFDLWLRMAERFALDNLSDALYQWRVSPASVYGARRTEQLRYCGIALVFALQRQREDRDGYGVLIECAGDLDRFAASYAWRGRLQALWGELLLRGFQDGAEARAHLWRAVLSGVVDPWTVALLGWSVLGLRWPGSAPLAVTPDS